MKYIMNKEGLV